MMYKHVSISAEHRGRLRPLQRIDEDKNHRPALTARGLDRATTRHGDGLGAACVSLCVCVCCLPSSPTSPTQDAPDMMTTTDNVH